MIAFIFGFIILIGGFVTAHFIKDYTVEKRGNTKAVSLKWARTAYRLAAIIIAAIFIAISCFTQVQTGHTGIPVIFGEVQDYTVEAGPQVHGPWLNIVQMDNREQRYHFDLLAFSADMQEVHVTGSVNYRINSDKAMTLYKTIGIHYESILIEPRAYEAVKGTFSIYGAEGLMEHRTQLAPDICTTLSNDISNSGITVLSVSIEDIDFTDVFTQAVEAKQVATQEKIRAQTEEEQKNIVAEKQAERKIIAAKADAEEAKIGAEAELEVVKIQAEAALYAGEKEAEMNKRISESLSGELLYYYWIKQWNGKLPTVSTDTMMPFFDIGDIIEDE